MKHCSSLFINEKETNRVSSIRAFGIMPDEHMTWRNKVTLIEKFQKFKTSQQSKKGLKSECTEKFVFIHYLLFIIYSLLLFLLSKSKEAATGCVL